MAVQAFTTPLTLESHQLEKLFLNRVDFACSDNDLYEFFAPFVISNIVRSEGRIEVSVNDADTVLFEKTNGRIRGQRVNLSLPVVSGLVHVESRTRRAPPVSNKRNSERRRPISRGRSDFEDVF